MPKDDPVFEFPQSEGSPPTDFRIRVLDDGSLDVDVGAEYGGVLDAASASRLAKAILMPKTDSEGARIWAAAGAARELAAYGCESPTEGMVALLLAAARLSLATELGRDGFIGAAKVAHGQVVQDEIDRKETD